MLVSWPGAQPLSDAAILILLFLAVLALTALVFRFARRRAARDRANDTSDQD